jgi:hypothetical protein
MSETESVAIARIGQKVDDLKETMSAFIAESKAKRNDCDRWRAEVDADRNRAKGALLAASFAGGALGAVFSALGRFIRLPI